MNIRSKKLSMIGFIIFIFVLMTACGGGGGSSSSGPQTSVDVKGTWEGTWQSSMFFVSGTFTARIIQNGSTLSGSIDVPEIGMFNAGLKGTVTGTTIVFGDIEEEITFTGTVTGNSSSGTYVYPSLSDNGTWHATKSDSSPILDTTFGTDGIVVTDIHCHVDALRIQSDGKIVVAGHSHEDFVTNIDFIVIRYNTDGSLDTTFGIDGIVTTDISNSDNYASDLGIQSDGKIIVMGSTDGGGGDADFTIVRYNTDGSLDTTFGTDGVVTTDIGSDDIPDGLGIQPDDKIVVAGSTENDFAIVRYDADGSLDTTFGTDGVIITDIDNSDDSARDLGIQSDGKIIVAGSADVGGGNVDFAMVRYNADGSLDTTFGTDGIVTTDIGWNDDAYGLCIQTDSKIVVAGYANIDWSDIDFAMVRYNADGSLDTTFGTDGIVNNFDGYYYFTLVGRGIGIGIQSDGKIVVAGSHPSYWTVVRYNINGSRDTTFGADGIEETDLGSSGGWDYSRVLGIQPDGRIVVAGCAGSSYVAVTRYLP